MEERRDKTRVYLERVKTLEERAKVAIGFATSFAGVTIALITLFKHIAGYVASIGFSAAALALTLAAYNYHNAERLWERLLKDPLDKHTLLVILYGASLLAGLLAIIILWALGIWR